MADSDLLEENVKLREKVTELNDAIAGYKRLIAGSTRKDEQIRDLKDENGKLRKEVFSKDNDAVDEQQRLLDVIDTLQTSIHKFKVRQERDNTEISTLKNDLWNLREKYGEGTGGKTQAVSTATTQCDMDEETQQERIRQYESILASLTEKSRKLNTVSRRRERVDSIASVSGSTRSPRASSAGDSISSVILATPMMELDGSNWVSQITSRIRAMQASVESESKTVSSVTAKINDMTTAATSNNVPRSPDRGAAPTSDSPISSPSRPMPKLKPRASVAMSQEEREEAEKARAEQAELSATVSNALQRASESVPVVTEAGTKLSAAIESFKAELPNSLNQLDAAITNLAANTAEWTADMMQQALDEEEEVAGDDPELNLSAESAQAILTANAFPAWERITNELHTAQLELVSAQEEHEAAVKAMSEEREKLLDELNALNELHEFQESNATIQQDNSPARRFTTSEDGGQPSVEELEQAHEEVVHALHMQLMARAEQALQFESRIAELEAHIAAATGQEEGDGTTDGVVAGSPGVGITVGKPRAFPHLPRNSALQYSMSAGGGNPALEYSLAESEEAILADIEQGGPDVHERSLDDDAGTDDADEASFLQDVISLRKRLAKTNFKYLNKTLGQELNFSQLVHLSNTNLDAIAARARRLSFRARAERRDERGGGARNSALAQQISVLIVESAALRKQLNDYAEAAIAATMEKERAFREAHGLPEPQTRRRKSTAVGGGPAGAGTGRNAGGGFSTTGERLAEQDNKSKSGKKTTGQNQAV